MNRAILMEFQKMDKRMGGYVGLLKLRYANLCVKADAVALLCVDVQDDGETLNIEDVAKVKMEGEYQMHIYPEDEELLPNIAKGILSVHPEFKQEILDPEEEEVDESSNPYLIQHSLMLTMPEVDDDRYDLLTNGIKGLRDQCQAKLDAIYPEYWNRVSNAVEQEEPAKKEKSVKTFEDRRKLYNDQVKEMYETKLKEIEEGHQRWLASQQEKEASVAAEGKQAGMSMKMGGNANKE